MWQKGFPQYEIYKGAVWFWHKGYWFKLAREDQNASGMMTLQNLEKLTLTVLGRSTQPIKDLITEAVLQREISEQMHKNGKRE
jgi:chaperone BCS1